MALQILGNIRYGGCTDLVCDYMCLIQFTILLAQLIIEYEFVKSNLRSIEYGYT